MADWYVYLLRCCDGSLYAGSTTDVERRLRTHQRGTGAKYTRSRLPVELAYREAAADKSAALRREAALKRMTRKEKLALIAGEEHPSMNMRRSDRAIDAAEAWAAVDACPFATLSMTAEDGTPYAVTLNIVREGDCVYFHSAREGRKTDCLRRRPQVCLTCVGNAQVDAAHTTTRYVSAVAFGRAEEVEEPAERARILHLLCRRYQVPESHPQLQTEFERCLPVTAIWRIRVDTLTGKANRG